MELPHLLSDEPAVLDIDMARIHEAATTRARRRLHDLIPAQARTYCTVDTAVVEGRAYREILRQAAERQSDCIVMGVHGRGALDSAGIRLHDSPRHSLSHLPCPHHTASVTGLCVASRERSPSFETLVRRMCSARRPGDGPLIQAVAVGVSLRRYRQDE